MSLLGIFLAGAIAMLIVGFVAEFSLRHVTSLPSRSCGFCFASGFWVARMGGSFPANYDGARAFVLALGGFAGLLILVYVWFGRAKSSNPHHG